MDHRSSSSGASGGSAAQIVGWPPTRMPAAAALVWDPSLRITQAGRGVNGMLGLSEEPLVGRHLGDTFDGPHARSWIEACTSALSQGMDCTLLSRKGVIRMEAAPLPSGAVALLRRAPPWQDDFQRQTSIFLHELRNAFTSVALVVCALQKTGEVQSDAGRQRLDLADRELVKINDLFRKMDRPLSWTDPSLSESP